MRLTPGLRLGPYEVLAVLGTGGMAEVYRGRDTRLGRDIAIKVVNESLATNPELVGRFEREARLAGSLNHPNLVAVYDVGQHEGSPFLVTELLQGESLRKRLSRGPIPVKTAVDWAAQMARGLAAAHARGVVHRDVKPDNVFIVTDGQVKLLDFGIAKLSEVPPVGAPRGLMDATETPTGGATGTGAMLGTPGYMSPEQVRGESVDARSDVFSLGAVIHEMLSGQRPFPGDPLESSYAILHKEPAALSDALPRALVQVVNRCLEKEPSRRCQSVSDLAFDLDVLRDSTGLPGSKARASMRSPFPRLRLTAWSALLVLVGIGIASVATRGPASHPPPPVQVEQLTHRGGTVGAGRFMGDGRVAFSAAFEGTPEELFIREAGNSSTQALGLKSTRLAAVSRTGELAVLLDVRLAAFARPPSGTLARVPAVGGAPREIAEDVSSADWSPAGELAIVVEKPGEGATLEFPPGNLLFRTKGWISDLRFSIRGDRIAFVHHPIYFERMGEVTLVDLKGRSQPLGQRWPAVMGLAWAEGDSEVWFTAGTLTPDTLFAISLNGKVREVFRSLSHLRLDDLSHDGAVLLSSGVQRRDTVLFESARVGTLRLPWSDWNVPVAISNDRRVLVNETTLDPSGPGSAHTLAMLRRMDGSAAQLLGEFTALDLSLDGRWALGSSYDENQVLIVPTGPGVPRAVNTHGLKLAGGARFLPDDSGIVLLGRTEADDPPHFYLLKEDDSAPTRISEAPFTSPLFFPYGGNTGLTHPRLAAVSQGPRTVVVSLRDHAVYPVRGLGGSALPCGWSSDGSLWVRVGLERSPATAEMVRVDIGTGRVLERHMLGPAEPTGVTMVDNVFVSPDGTGFIYSYTRDLGSLFILKGLNTPGQ